MSTDDVSIAAFQNQLRNSSHKHENVLAASVPGVWKAIGTLIGQAMSEGKGFNVPHFAQFTFTRDEATTPVFVLSSTFIRKYNVSYTNPLSTMVLKSTSDLTCSAIALQSGISAEQVSKIMQALFAFFGTLLYTKRANGQLTLFSVGVLMLETNSVQFKFSSPNRPIIKKRRPKKKEFTEFGISQTSQDAHIVKAASSDILPRFLLPQRGPIEMKKEVCPHFIEQNVQRVAKERRDDTTAIRTLDADISTRHKLAYRKHLDAEVNRRRQQKDILQNLSSQVQEKKTRDKIEQKNMRQAIGGGGISYPMESLEAPKLRAARREQLYQSLKVQEREKRYIKHHAKILDRMEGAFFINAVSHQSKVEKNYLTNLAFKTKTELMQSWAAEKK